MNDLAKVVNTIALGYLIYLSIKCPCNEFIQCSQTQYYSTLFLVAAMPTICSYLP